MKRRIIVTWWAGFIGSNFLNKYVLLFPDIDFINVDCLTYAGKLEHLSDEVKSSSNYFFEKVDIRNFEWLEINMFSSRGRRYKKEIDEEKEIEPFLYSINDIARILDKINEYLKEYWLNDENINYSKDLKEWRWSSEKKISRASMVLDRLLSSIFGYNIRLKDKNVWWKLGSRAHLSSKYGSIIDPMQFYIDYSTDEWTQSDNFEANVLLKDEE